MRLADLQLIDDGRVVIAWELGRSDSGEPRFRMSWREKDGPPVATPTRKGFGTTLIERELKYTLGGSARFNYGDGGFEAHISLPFDSKVMSLGPSTPQRSRKAGTGRD